MKIKMFHVKHFDELSNLANYRSFYADFSYKIYFTTLRKKLVLELENGIETRKRGHRLAEKNAL